MDIEEERPVDDQVDVNREPIRTKVLPLAACAIFSLLGSILIAQYVPELSWLRITVVMPIILFLPGALALNAIGIKMKSFAEFILMALGTSIALVMLLGLSVNFMGPLAGVDKPLSAIPLMVSMAALLAILAIAAAIRQGGVAELPRPVLKVRPYHFYLALIPLVTLLGVMLQNLFSSNLVLMASLVMIGSTIALASLGKIPREAYPLTIFLMALSLLIHTVLISDFMWGWDIHREYYSATSVIGASYWEPNPTTIKPLASQNVDAMLSIVILGPLLSILGGLDMETVFRTVYPAIFSFVPVALYLLFRKQTNEEVALLSSFFIMSLVTFFAELPQLARQEIAELFVVLLLLILISTEIARPQKTALFVLFSFSLIVSHYATYYFFIAILLMGFVFGKLLQMRKKAHQRETVHPSRLTGRPGISLFSLGPIPILLTVLLSLAWYKFTQNSAPIISIVNVFNNMMNSIRNGMFSSGTINGISIIRESSGTLADTIWEISQIVIAVAILIGTYFVLKGLKNRPEATLAPINLAALGVLIACMILPNLATSLNSARIYHLALLFLAPSVVVGMTIAVEKILSITSSTRRRGYHPLRVVSMIVILSLAYNAGLIHQLASESSTSFALDENYDFPVFTDGEVAGTKWTILQGPSSLLADDYRLQLFYSFAPDGPRTIPPREEGIIDHSLIFLGKYNLEHHEVFIRSGHISWEDRGLTELEIGSSTVYANDFSEVWYYDRMSDPITMTMGM